MPKGHAGPLIGRTVREPDPVRDPVEQADQADEFAARTIPSKSADVSIRAWGTLAHKRRPVLSRDQLLRLLAVADKPADEFEIVAHHDSGSEDFRSVVEPDLGARPTQRGVDAEFVHNGHLRPGSNRLVHGAVRLRELQT